MEVLLLTMEKIAKMVKLAPVNIKFQKYLTVSFYYAITFLKKKKIDLLILQ